MVIIAFEHFANVTKPLRKLAMAKFSGEMVHCELISTTKHIRMSAWWPEGVAIKSTIVYNQHYEFFKIGDYDTQVLDFFRQHEGKPYNLNGLVWNMLFNQSSNGKRHFCSQICYDALNHVGIVLPVNRTESLSPQEFYFIVKSNFQQLYN